VKFNLCNIFLDSQQIQNDEKNGYIALDISIFIKMQEFVVIILQKMITILLISSPINHLED